jgi:hypothetical protein
VQHAALEEQVGGLLPPRAIAARALARACASARLVLGHALQVPDVGEPGIGGEDLA